MTSLEPVDAGDAGDAELGDSDGHDRRADASSAQNSVNQTLTDPLASEQPAARRSPSRPWLKYWWVELGRQAKGLAGSMFDAPGQGKRHGVSKPSPIMSRFKVEESTS